MDTYGHLMGSKLSTLISSNISWFPLTWKVREKSGNFVVQEKSMYYCIEQLLV